MKNIDGANVILDQEALTDADIIRNEAKTHPCNKCVYFERTQILDEGMLCTHYTLYIVCTKKERIRSTKAPCKLLDKIKEGDTQ